MQIDITSLGFLSSTTTAFLNKESRLTEIVSEKHPFFNIENAIKGKANFELEKRKILVEVLNSQYKDILTKEDVLVKQNIDLLLQEDTFTITTGQQLHLFLGPVFMVYKLISTIKAAEHFKQQFSDKNFVPVFWLASEDHDFEEIKNTILFGQTFAWETQQNGATGEYHLQDLPSLFEAIKQRFEKDEKTVKLVSEFEQFYAGSDNLAEATIKVVHHFFGKYGIVCLDANCKELKTFFKSIVKQELLSENNFIAFNEFSNQLKNKELSLQLSARKINLFYLEKGSRNRIEKTEKGYQIIGAERLFSEKEILNLVETNPEKFSPNAVLRPLYQETILPNVAYIGGNAEINYWLQLAKVFENCKILAPSLILRQSVWYISTKTNEWLNNNNIELIALFKANKAVEFVVLIDKNATNPFSQYLQQFLKLKSEIQNEAANTIGSELKQIVELGKTYEKSLKNLEQKHQDFLSNKNQKSIKKLEQIKMQGFDKNNIQERSTFTIEMMLKVENLLKNTLEKLEFAPLKTTFFKY